MNSQTAQVDDLQLVSMPSAVSCANLFVRFTLTEWSLRPLVEEAGRAVSRFVSAVVDRADPREPGFLTVRLRLSGEYLIVEVEDDQSPASAAAPVMEGRRTGVERVAGTGRLVWCELPLPPGTSATDVRLPRRSERRRSLVTEQMRGEPVEVDPRLVERILTGLSRTGD
ncbi:hypothetical protein SAMN05421810_101668 [Amycolatopsis arida]|uniref:Histidine kinase-like ATPase domain-containing protein n=1 Tax=Amycolatopsis arida TaxID=587909 RepID=A0A1I5LU87_9PSEU|nr:histidine kinase [Amycolatopsis arida]TDX93844.1 hypothetical protein CLV69_104301 [Amycolatopsis arida]SFP00723.1 hypothetical protein SAMN05421810_101668 [Amycolatopsis arida]